MIRFFLLFLFLSIVLFADVKFGYVSGGINEFTMTQYKKDIFSEYFNKKTGEKIIIIRYNSYSSLKAAIKSKKIDTAIIANYQYRNFMNDSIPVVNVSKAGKRMAGYLILIKNPSSVKGISDLNSKILACDGKLGTISFLSSVIKKNPRDFFSEIIKTRNPSKLLGNVVSGKADLTVINEGMYESILKYRPNYKKQLKILFKSKSYASDLIIASKKFSAPKIRGMKSLFLNMRKDPEGAQVLISLKLTGFYSPITDMDKYPRLVLYKVTGKKEIDNYSDTTTNVEMHAHASQADGDKKYRKKRKRNKKSKYISHDKKQPENLENMELKKIRAENKKLQEELSNKEKLQKQEKIEKEREITRIREAQKRALAQKPKIIKIVKSVKKDDKSSIILYIILGLFVIVIIIIIILLKRMKKQEKVLESTTGNRVNPLLDNFYGDTGSGVKTSFNIDMPDFSGATVIGNSVVRIALKGKLDELYIARVFKQLMDESKTGVLTLTLEGPNPQIIDIQFNNGKVLTAFCKTGSFQTKFKNQIIKELPLLKDKIEVLYNNSLNNQEQFCSVLRNQNLIESSKLDSLVLLQAKEIILSIFLWKTGNYEFREIIDDNLDFEDNNKLQLDVTALIKEGINRYKEWKYISKIISRASDKVDFLEGKRADLIANSTNKNLLEIIDLIDGKRTIKEIGALSRFSDFKILKLLARLKEKGYIHFFS